MRNLVERIKKKYLMMTPEVKASVLFTICSLFQKSISFLIVPIYTRIMSAQEYGLYSIFLAWYQLLMIFTTLNMWNYLINNGMTKYKYERKQFISSLQGLSTVITLVWFIIYLFLANIWEILTGLSLPMMLMMFAELLFMPSYEYYCSVKRYQYKTKNVLLLTGGLTILIPIVSIPLILYMDNKGMAAIIGRVGASVFIYAIVFFYLIREGKTIYKKEYWVYALKFNIPLIPHFLSMMILQQSDRIMIERMCGEKDVAMYSVAYQAAVALQILNSSVLSSFIPYTYKVLKQKQGRKLREKADGLLMFIGLINILAILLAPEIIHILAPREYHMAVYVIPPVALSNLFMFLFNLFANIEYYFEKTKYVAIASVISAVINVIFNYIFIPKFGFAAAGYTTLGCYMLFSVCHYVFMRKTEKEFLKGEHLYNINTLALISLICVVFGISIIAIFPYAVIRYTLIMLGILIGFWKRKELMSIVKSDRTNFMKK